MSEVTSVDTIRTGIRLSAAVAATVFSMAFAGGDEAWAGIVSPRQGGPLPREYLELKARSRSAFMIRHGWLERRRRQLRGEGSFQLSAAARESVLRNPERAVNGHFGVPVLMGLYSNMSAPPITAAALSAELFNGPWPTGTLRSYFREVSYNLFDVSGAVYDWVQLSQAEVYYTGGAARGLDTALSKTGDMIKELADALDPTVDFGVYDNDGPDGIPNSGDDDGFVDVLVVVHPTWGAECDNSLHMWSHSYVYSSWPIAGGQPYSTNDPSARGGTIRIDDYILVPAVSCNKASMIEIGVICHEFGHVIGLPDLYDWDGGSSGIGYWGLMAAGNWNTPESPAHLCGWTREQLGWVNPVEIDWRGRQVALMPVETSGEVLKMPLPTRRFKRQLYALNNYGLLCSYPASEAEVRGWPGGEGYGNDWRESVCHEFTVDASRPVTLQYDVSFEVERNYDVGKLLVEFAGAVETLAVYTDRGSVHETIDVGSHIPVGPCTFTLRYLFLSDFSVSDEDGGFDSRAGYSFTIDNVRLTGGGVDYFADFQLDSGGWRNDSEPAEYFLVENRRRSGFDKNLLGEGLLIWHAENSLMYSYLGNSGGATNRETRGITLEEADGEYNLIIPDYLGGNFGDAGDPYPGITGNRAFGPTTVPRNQTNGGVVTPVMITGITHGSPTSSALFKAGMPAPEISAVLPDTIDKETDTEAVLDIRGAWMLRGASAYLSLAGDTVRALQASWFGEERIIATFPIEELYAGLWNLTIVSGDGQETTALAAVTVKSIYEAARVVVGRSSLRAEWTLKEMAGIRGCLLFRSANEGAFTLLSPDTLRGSLGQFSYEDSTVVPDVRYSYRIVTYLNGGKEEIYVLTGPYRVRRHPFLVDQNYPNPFNARTTLSFFVPATQLVTIEIYDVSGRLVERLASRLYGRGTQSVEWDASIRRVSPGLYFCRVTGAGAERIIKMIYLR